MRVNSSIWRRFPALPALIWLAAKRRETAVTLRILDRDIQYYVNVGNGHMVAVLQRRRDTLQAKLAAERAKLAAERAKLAAERAKLAAERA